MQTALARLRSRGDDILCTSHAEAILANDFPDALKDIADVLAGFSIQVEEFVRGGGGESPITQRLRQAFEEKKWTKREFQIRKLIDDRQTQATSHSVDHVKVFDNGTLALEIEWNNKDPFYDRDLDNFKRLHADGGISAGIIVTRGRSLQDNLSARLLTFARRKNVLGFADLDQYEYHPTPRQIKAIKQLEAKGNPFSEAWVSVFKADKFGEATTHWKKLESRVTRGAGNPCPLLLMGLPANIVVDSDR